MLEIEDMIARAQPKGRPYGFVYLVELTRIGVGRELLKSYYVCRNLEEAETREYFSRTSGTHFTKCW